MTGGTAGLLRTFIAMQRLHWVSGLAFVLLMSGCQRESPAETAAQDARDVAEVKALQKVHPPLQPVVPQPMTPEELAEAAKLARPRDTPDGSPPDLSVCAFVIGPASDGAPVLTADAQRALLKIDGRLVVLASDSGAPKLAPGLHAKYVGRMYWVSFARAPDTLTVHDRFDRVVYEASGTLRCADSPAL
jgi:hypothetical protein